MKFVLTLFLPAIGGIRPYMSPVTTASRNRVKLTKSYDRDNKVALKSAADLPHQLNQFFLCFLRNLKSLFLESDTSCDNCAPKKSHTLSQGPLKISLSQLAIYFVSNCKTRKLTFSTL